MNRNSTIAALLLVASVFIGGWVRSIVHAEHGRGPTREQLPAFHEARQDYLLWQWRSGETEWQRQRARELDALRGVGGGR